MKKTAFAIFMALILLFGLAACDRVKIELQEPEEPISEDVGELIPVEPDDATEEEESSEHPYISITYGRKNPDNFTDRDMVFYTYDLVTKELKEECVIPLDSDYASGVVSKANNTVYYSRRAEAENLSSNDCLFAYDLATGESEMLESENFSYNEITIIDEDTLLVMAVTNEHPIMPALFDLKTKSFTYMADANGEPFRLYNSFDSPINYNYNTKSFINVYKNEEEAYSNEYLTFKKKIPTYISLVNNDLKKDSDKVFSINLRVGDFIQGAVQISENELLVERFIEYLNDDKLDTISRIYYSLVFKENGETTFTEVEPPFPLENVRSNGYQTVDGGKTWYLIFDKGNSYQPGLYAYDTETKELTPILLHDSASAGHVVNFSIVGPEKKDSAEKEIPEGYRKVEFEGCSVLIGNNFYQSGTPVEEILPFENQLMGDDGEKIRVIAEFLSAEDIADLNAPFAAADEKYAASINTVELSLGGFAAKKYHVQTTLEGPVPATANMIYYCIKLDDKIVTFAYYPVMGRGGLHTEDMEAILDTIRIS